MSPPALPSFPKVATAVAVTLTLAAVTAFGTAPLREVDLPPVQTIIERVAIAPPAQGVEATPAPLQRYTRSERLRRGETLVSLLDRLGATDVDFQKFVAADRQARKLMQLQAGRTVNALIDEAGRVQALHYRYANLDSESDEPSQPTGRVTIRRIDDGFVASDEPIVLEREVATAVAEIRTSLFAAIDAAGIPEAVATRVADILDGEVDFNRDLRRGDLLRVVYEAIRETDSLDPPTIGRILALEFTIDGTRHEAVWFDREDSGHGEYFSFDGRSLRKAFLQHPVEFSRISSGFSSARMHPILKYTREHKGVDFAAPIGTKVRSSGDGVVEFIGQQRGYGNLVEVRHRNGISTLYAHLKAFASGLSKGAKVAQGAVIGYVGTTGWSTGPHLHYEFKVNGEHVNPLLVALPPAAPLDAAQRGEFIARTAGLRTRLAQTGSVVRLARFE
ncbi:MAG: peptidoglycan DD-metalloendopeptidase family protein [Burkholderiaceae bacterium]|nr:peptidoglycan DD-metalloendopeptidase family protein [Burkholderiaceae bacterium]MEB2350973.1 peptidoglycan DD-metalloendopeptidase family protein [Burkholderiaceae bacterium]